MVNKQINNFKVMQLRYSSKNSTYHELFIKEHSLRHKEEDKPLGLTLFVLNIPPYITEAHMKDAFSEFGNIASVKFQEKETNDKRRSSFNNGYVVFSKRSGLLKCLQASSISLENVQIKAGLSKYIEQYNNSIVNPEELQKEITTYMKGLDKKEQKKDKSESEMEVDDDGWTVVTKKGRNPGLARKESVTIKLEEKMKEKSKKKELKNFYTFQIRESKMKNVIELRKSYEEAKKKVALMKASRKFKPY
ncbi:hypothetical protein GWI33_002113 [Rhynchophorus ferrugineus]|uniref:RRM domain-containing protein n=1 Tax=Rhynchophorus ferrugineus TaxID=354439 RepID=A0A834MLH7_RHYFE|nr:hypothetical protein GWI33_002113 [Rhynchophorus ferrugineus]